MVVGQAMRQRRTSSARGGQVTPEAHRSNNGGEVLVDPVEQQTSYLQLYDINNGDSKCFEINGVNSLLSLTAIDNGNLLIMNK
jgi:hypothetical protein